jgi:hypothetical protein
MKEVFFLSDKPEELGSILKYIFIVGSSVSVEIGISILNVLFLKLA